MNGALMSLVANARVSSYIPIPIARTTTARKTGLAV